MARLGTLLLVVGMLTAGYGALWQLGLVPGSRVVLPAPIVLDHREPGVREVSAPATPVPIALPTRPPPEPRLPAEHRVQIASTPVELPTPAPTPTLEIPREVPADGEDRKQARRPEMGYAVRLAIPAINLDTVVKQAGIVPGADGHPVWQTLPFVAVHYGDLTSLIGAPGNAVIAGHVVTMNEGNVFRFLYKLGIDDQIQVWDDHQHEHDFQVVDIKLVAPSDTSVMAPTPDQTLTLITCGGTFDPIKREFSDRLVVTAKPIAADAGTS